MGGVYSLVYAHEVDVERGELLRQLDEVLRRPADAVELLDDDDVARPNE